MHSITLRKVILEPDIKTRPVVSGTLTKLVGLLSGISASTVFMTWCTWALFQSLRFGVLEEAESFLLGNSSSPYTASLNVMKTVYCLTINVTLPQSLAIVREEGKSPNTPIEQFMKRYYP